MTVLVLFYAYRAGDEFRKEKWGATSDGFKQLAEAYEIFLCDNTNLFSQDLFNEFREEFRDWPSLQDSTPFPRTGQVGASVTSILEYVLPRASRVFGIVSSCSNPACSSSFPPSSNVPSSSFPSICMPLQWVDQEPLLSLPCGINIQNWFDLWQKVQYARNSRMNPPTHSLAACHGFTTLRIHLTTHTPILFFECVPLYLSRHANQSLFRISAE